MVMLGLGTYASFHLGWTLEHWPDCSCGFDWHFEIRLAYVGFRIHFWRPIVAK